MTSIKFCCYILKRNSDCHLKKKDSEVSKKNLLQASDEFLKFFETSEIQYTLYTDSRVKELWLFLCGCWATLYLHLYSNKSFLLWMFGIMACIFFLLLYMYMDSKKLGTPKIKQSFWVISTPWKSSKVMSHLFVYL